MKKRHLILVCFLLSGLLSKGQSSIQDPEILEHFKSMPQESIYVHYNTSSIFSGEHLKYKIYCLNNATRNLSDISQIAYVALVNRNAEPVFIHKVRLHSGVGYGDFFVPTEVPTGSYKLVGYTGWMKNNAIENFFQTDIRLINPYQPIPEDYLAKAKDSLQAQENGSLENRMNTDKQVIENDYFTLSLSNAEYGHRQSVQLKLVAKNESARNGKYSLSVRKRDAFGVSQGHNAEAFFADFLKKVNLKTSIEPTRTHIPELRGELISGVVTDKASGAPAPSQKLALSLPGDDYLFQIARTDQQGKFYFVVDEAYDNERAILQLLSTDWDSYEISVHEVKDRFNGLVFEDFTISEDLRNTIIQRSVENQIENAYVSVRSDSIIPAQHPTPFYRNFNSVYHLDDYTRFNSLQETIIEIVDQVSIKRMDDGDRVFQIRPEEGFTDSGLLPMVFVDGLYLKRHEDFMGYSAKKIKSIRFSRDKYLVGSEMFQGMLLFETVDGNFLDTFYTPHIVGVDLFKPQSAKNYFAQEYTESSKSERIPDYRSQLLWLPNVEVTGEETDINFYTSDLSGEFEINLEGFTDEGRPVSLRSTIQVK